MSDKESAKRLLDAAEVFYGSEGDLEEAHLDQVLNMNDVWCWACAWGEPVADEELPEVARLFREYGWAGILYWVSEKHNGLTSEFYDNNRYIEFVRNEERIRKEVPDSNKRAYHKESYQISGERKP